MKIGTGGWIAFAFVAVVVFFLLQGPAKPENEFHRKMLEITEGKQTRMEKVSAVYAFVRDEIQEIKTKYG